MSTTMPNRYQIRGDQLQTRARAALQAHAQVLTSKAATPDVRIEELHGHVQCIRDSMNLLIMAVPDMYFDDWLIRRTEDALR